MGGSPAGTGPLVREQVGVSTHSWAGHSPPRPRPKAWPGWRGAESTPVKEANFVWARQQSWMGRDVGGTAWGLSRAGRPGPKGKLFPLGGAPRTAWTDHSVQPYCRFRNPGVGPLCRPRVGAAGPVLSRCWAEAETYRAGAAGLGLGRPWTSGCAKLGRGAVEAFTSYTPVIKPPQAALTLTSGSGSGCLQCPHHRAPVSLGSIQGLQTRAWLLHILSLV